jgi:hypothetical protein
VGPADSGAAPARAVAVGRGMHMGGGLYGGEGSGAWAGLGKKEKLSQPKINSAFFI